MPNLRFLVLISVFIIASSLLISGCKKASKPLRSHPPLQDNLTLTYKALRVMGAIRLDDVVKIKITKYSNNKFLYTSTTTNKNGNVYLSDERVVDGFFRYKKNTSRFRISVQDYPIWESPRLMSKGKIGRFKVTKTQWKEKNAYLVKYKPKSSLSRYYARDTGILLAVDHFTGRATITIRLIED